MMVTPAWRTPTNDLDRIRNEEYQYWAEVGRLDREKWLAGDALSFADLAAGGHFSVLDYLGEVPWEEFPQAKQWYALLKSRPSFRPLLTDRLPGLPPPRLYAELDF